MATWVLADESCNINYLQNGVSHRTLPKELTVLEIVPVGSPLNDTTVDCVFIRYEGKYAIELPYNDTTIGATGYATAELLRAAILALLNSNPCAGGGGGSVGTLQQVTDLGADTDNTMNVTSGGGAEPKSTISASSVRAGDNGTQLESTLNSDGTVKATDNGNSTYTKLNPNGSISFAYGTSGASLIGLKKIHLTSAQIQSGNTTPIVLVAAQGAGTAIYAWHDTTARCINGAVPAVATYMAIKSASAGKPMTTFASSFLANANPNPIMGDDSTAINDTDVIIINDDLVVAFEADNPGFDGTIDIYLKYEIITL